MQESEEKYRLINTEGNWFQHESLTYDDYKHNEPRSEERNRHVNIKALLNKGLVSFQNSQRHNKSIDFK